MSETDEMSKSDSETSHHHEDADVDIMMDEEEVAEMDSTAIHHIPVYPHRNKEERKRRRVIGNTDNTLDGLVAKRAEMDPLTKRYQTETDAIVLPDDEVEMKVQSTLVLVTHLDLVTPPENFTANTTTQGCIAKV
jgi:hypothetical protein